MYWGRLLQLLAFSLLEVLILSPRIASATASPLLSASSQEEALALLKSAQGKLPLENGDITQLIKKGWYSVSKEVIISSHAHGIDLSAEVRRVVGEVRNELDDLVRYLNKAHSDIQVMSPAFQWAQSADSIFLNIKFAYRFNSPGALKVTDENITTTDTSFFFSGIGTHSQIQKRYELSLDLFDGVDPQKTEWSFGSVGKLGVTLKKLKRSKWKRLTKSTDKISNMHVWWELKEKYASELNNIEKEKHQTPPPTPAALGENATLSDSANDTVSGGAPATTASDGSQSSERGGAATQADGGGVGGDSSSSSSSSVKGSSSDGSSSNAGDAGEAGNGPADGDGAAEKRRNQGRRHSDDDNDDDDEDDEDREDGDDDDDDERDEL